MNRTCITEDSKGIACGAPGAWELVVDGQTVLLCEACYQRALAGDFGNFEVARATRVGGCSPDEFSEQQMKTMLGDFRAVDFRPVSEPAGSESVMLATVIGSLLIKHKVIDAAALNDPEGYDKGHTANGILLAAHDLLDFLGDRMDRATDAKTSGGGTEQ